VRQLRQEGRSIRQIAEATGAGYGTVREALRADLWSDGRSQVSENPATASPVGNRSERSRDKKHDYLRPASPKNCQKAAGDVA
jgi:hypothetical protein